MALATRRALPTSTPDHDPPSWLNRRYRLLAEAMLACRDWERAAADEERALLCEHQTALGMETTAGPALLADPGAGVEAILHRLLRGGATDIAVTTHPLWLVGHGPSGRQWQILWAPRRQAYCVSRWTTDENGTEGLGHFPAWGAAVACALEA